MTLTTNTALSSRSLTYFVRIYTTPGTYSGANVLILPTNPTSATGTPAIEAIRVSKSFDSPVPVCQIDLSRVPTWITRGQGVTVDVGYNGLTQRLFTGFIQSRERRVGKGSIQCMGRLWTAFRTVQIGSRSVDGVSVSSAIGTILDYVGITDNRLLDVPAFTLGTASSPVLERMPASQMLQVLMDIDGCRIYELGSGQIIVKVITEAPAATAYKTYTTNANATARVLEASDREDPEYYRNRVIVTGATVTEGAAPDETSRTITATATNTGSALVQPALPSGTYIDAEYNNHLIDTDAKAASVAIRLLAKFARIPRQLQIELAGDPELELGQTLAFVMPELDLNDRGFISGIEHVIDGNGYVTRLTDFRGAGDTGGTLSQNPIAAFTFKSELEVFGAVTNVFAALDASNSFDPDGTIASYAWSDNQTTSPEIATLTTQQVTVRADTSAWTGSWSVTLTVTDNDGLTGATTITVPYKNTDAEIVMPAIYAAINNRHSASLDGGVTWKDSTVGSGNSISVGARPADGVNVGHACYGTSTGRIYRTTDGGTTVTLVYTSAAAVAINDVQWDWRNGNVVWAIDENCIVYISLDAGVTWSIYSSLRTTLSLAGALGNKLGLPAAGGIYIFGGTGAGSPLIAYDPVVGSQAWTRPTFTGDLLTDTVTTPGDATLRIIDYTVGFSKECLILAWASGGGASITAVYSATSPPFSNSWAFTRASTTFGGLKSGRYVVSDNVLIKSDYFIAAFANRSVWYSTNGIAWTEVTNVMPAAVTPNHAIGMTGSSELTGIVGMFGVFMIAGSDGIYKYTPRIDATASYVRGGTGAGTAWPASAVGKKLSIGAPGAAVAASGRLFTLRVNNGIQQFDGGSWSSTGDGPGTKGGMLLKTFTNTWLYLDTIGASGTVYYSSDNAVTFTAIGNLTGNGTVGCCGFSMGQDGKIWAVMAATTQINNGAASQPLTILKSTDHGATFSDAGFVDPGFSITALGWTNVNIALLQYCSQITADKTSASNIFIACRHASALEPTDIYSTNGGSSWTVRITPTTARTRGSDTSTSTVEFVDNHRLLYTRAQTTGQIWRSDDYGENWYVHSGTITTASVDATLRYRSEFFGKMFISCRNSSTTTSGDIYVSTDNGKTWTLQVTLTVRPSSLEYDSTQDVLYAMPSNSGTQHIYKITGAASGSPVAVDITSNIAAGNNNPESTSLMVLP